MANDSAACGSEPGGQVLVNLVCGRVGEMHSGLFSGEDPGFAEREALIVRRRSASSNRVDGIAIAGFGAIRCPA